MRTVIGLRRDSTATTAHGTCISLPAAAIAVSLQLGTARRRDLFLKLLEETRRKYRFVVHGYVLMPEYFHLLITEPEVGDPSVVMKVVKQRFARRMKQKGKRSSSAQRPLWYTNPMGFVTTGVFGDHSQVPTLMCKVIG